MTERLSLRSRSDLWLPAALSTSPIPGENISRGRKVLEQPNRYKNENHHDSRRDGSAYRRDIRCQCPRHDQWLDRRHKGKSVADHRVSRVPEDAGGKRQLGRPQADAGPRRREEVIQRRAAIAALFLSGMRIHILV